MLLKSAGRTASGEIAVASQWRGGRVVCTLAWGWRAHGSILSMARTFCPAPNRSNRDGKDGNKQFLGESIRTLRSWSGMGPMIQNVQSIWISEEFFKKRAQLKKFDHNRSEKFCITTWFMKICSPDISSLSACPIEDERSQINEMKWVLIRISWTSRCDTLLRVLVLSSRGSSDRKNHRVNRRCTDFGLRPKAAI